MTLSMKKVASALSFAHLAGLGRGKAKAEDDGDDKNDRDHEDVTDGVKKGKGKADDDEPEKKDDDRKESDARAEDDDPDANASGDDLPDSDDGDEDDDGDKKGKKAKKAKAGDDYDEDDEKMKAGARKERARIGAILSSPAAARNIALAAELACETDLSPAQAIAILGKAGANVAGNPNRAANNPRVGPAGSPEITGKQAIDSSWDRAFAQVNPKRK
jgi:hypothetical protein